MALTRSKTAASPCTDVREVPASIGQRLLWLLDHYRGREGEMNEQIVRRIRGPLDTAALETALDELARRHEALRTTFRSEGRRLLQVVHAPRGVELRHVDCSSEAAMRDAVLDDARDALDPTAWPTRALLCRLADDEHVLALTVHHLAVDVTSKELAWRDLAALYARAVGAPAELPEVVWQYADWSEWLRGSLERGRLDRLQEYWRGALAGVEAPALDAPGRGRADGPAEPVVLERGVVEQLEATARSQRTTLFPVLLALFYAQIYRTTGQTRVAVASLLANRARAEIRDTVGYFVNMVLLPGTIDPDAPFVDAVRSARTTVLGSLMHQELPSQLLPPGAVAAPAGLRADEIVFQFHELEPLPQLHGLEVEDVRLLRARRRFPLELFVARGETGATVLVFYDDERFDPAFVAEFTEGFGELAAAVAADPERPVRELLAAHAVS